MKGKKAVGSEVEEKKSRNKGSECNVEKREKRTVEPGKRENKGCQRV